MTDNRYDEGIRIRREVMGDDFVDAALDRNAGTDGEDLQHHITATVWGSVWTRDGLANGLTREEITEAIIHASGYCGAPAALSAMKVAQEVLVDELGPKN